MQIELVLVYVPQSLPSAKLKSFSGPFLDL